MFPKASEGAWIPAASSAVKRAAGRKGPVGSEVGENMTAPCLGRSRNQGHLAVTVTDAGCCRPEKGTGVPQSHLLAQWLHPEASHTLCLPLTLALSPCRYRQQYYSCDDERLSLSRTADQRELPGAQHLLPRLPARPGGTGSPCPCRPHSPGCCHPHRDFCFSRSSSGRRAQDTTPSTSGALGTWPGPLTGFTCRTAPRSTACSG